jgi:metallo-beta-lactamase family protein
MEYLYQTYGLAIPTEYADHVGLLARIPLIPELDDAHIRMTELSAKIATVILQDTCHLFTKDVLKSVKMNKDPRKQLVPYLTQRSTDEVIERIQSYSFNQELEPCEGIVCTFIPNGHLSGSASILFEIRDGEYEKHTILFSGDTSGTKPIIFTKPLEIKGMKINTIISEATYNDKLIEKDNFEIEFVKYIQETCMEKRGSIVVPLFSVGRSTNSLIKLRHVYEEHPEFKNIKVYLASPMAVKSHRLLCSESNLEFYSEEWHKEIDIFDWKQVEYVESFKGVLKMLANPEPKIICASAGMVCAYSEYIIGQLISTRKHRVVFVGYQGEGTNGRLLLEGIQKTMTVEDAEGKKKSVGINAKISNVQGQSGHADYKELCRLWSSVEKKKLKTILLNHGNPDGMHFFKSELEKTLPNVDVKITKYNEVVRLC